MFPMYVSNLHIITSALWTFKNDDQKSPMSHDKERRCTWSISVDLGRRIRLEFTDFDLKSSDGCFDHYVQARFQSCFLIGQR